MICHLCKENIGPTNNRHIYYCSNKLISEPRNITRFNFYEFNRGIPINKDEIINWYIKDQLSLVDVAKLLNLTYSAASFILDYFDIPKRIHKDS